MREIDNNNISKLNFKGVQKVSNEEPVTEQPVATPIEQKNIDNLDKLPAATLGKSQVSSDTIDADIKFLEKNPVIASAIINAVDTYAKSHTEEETLQMLEKMHQELVKK